MKKKVTFKVLHAGCYPFDILYTVGSTEKEIFDYLKKKCNYELDEEEKSHIEVTGKSGRTVQFKNNAYLLWVSKPTLPLIGHEIFHVAELLMQKINAPLNDSTSEPYAYLIEHLWKQIPR